HGQPQPKPDGAGPVHTGTASVPFDRGCRAHEATSLALGVRIRGRTVLSGSLASSLMRPPRWRSESAFADALCFLVRSQARSRGHLAGARSPHSRTHCAFWFARKLAHGFAPVSVPTV